MTCFIAAIGLGLALGIPSSDKARAATVQALYENCKDKEVNALCIGYISGVGDMMEANGKMHAWGFSMCGSPSYSAMVQAFIKWAPKHPEE